MVEFMSWVVVSMLWPMPKPAEACGAFEEASAIVGLCGRCGHDHSAHLTREVACVVRKELGIYGDVGIMWETDEPDARIIDLDLDPGDPDDGRVTEEQWAKLVATGRLPLASWGEVIASRSQQPIAAGEAVTVLDDSGGVTAQSLPRRPQTA